MTRLEELQAAERGASTACMLVNGVYDTLCDNLRICQSKVDGQLITVGVYHEAWEKADRALKKQMEDKE